LSKLIERLFNLCSGGYLSEVNVELLYLNMKTAWYNRVEMKRLTQVNVFLHRNLLVEFRKIHWFFMPKNLLFVGTGQQHRSHPLKVKWSFPYVKSAVQITKLYIYFNHTCRYLHICFSYWLKCKTSTPKVPKIYSHSIASWQFTQTSTFIQSNKLEIYKSFTELKFQENGMKKIGLKLAIANLKKKPISLKWILNNFV
jgi:hypothetical protein